MGAAMAFVAGAGRLVVALLVCAGTLLLGAWGYSAWQTRAQQTKEAPLAIKKQWETQEVLTSMPVEVATAWRHGRIYYQVNISEYYKEKHNVQASAQVTLEFFDNDGFKLWDKVITWSSMTGLTDDTGIRGFSWKGDEAVGAEQYSRASGLEVGWRGVTKNPVVSPRTRPLEEFLPQPTAPASTAWKTLASWKGLTLGQNQAAVRTLLGAPKDIEHYGPSLQDWIYGDAEFGGAVRFKDGAVSSWRAPRR